MCILWFHKWGKWKKTGTQPTWERGLFAERFKFNELQMRHCDRCSSFQTREIDEDLIEAEREFKFQEALLKLKYNIE